MGSGVSRSTTQSPIVWEWDQLQRELHEAEIASQESLRIEEAKEASLGRHTPVIRNPSHAPTPQHHRHGAVDDIFVRTGTPLAGGRLSTPGGNLSTSRHHSIKHDGTIQLDTSFAANCVTPRRQEALYSSIARTPMGEEKNQFKYYCPLCMSFYKDILKSTCCGNYVCYPCCFEFLLVRGVQVSSMNEIFNPTLLKNIRCPNCGTLGFSPMLVAPQDSVRDYISSNTPSHNAVKWRGASPIKIGDSFEELKRKMITYKDIERQTNRSSQSRNKPSSGGNGSHSNPLNQSTNNPLGIALGTAGDSTSNETSTTSESLEERGVPIIENEEGFQPIEIPVLEMFDDMPLAQSPRSSQQGTGRNSAHGQRRGRDRDRVLGGDDYISDDDEDEELGEGKEEGKRQEVTVAVLRRRLSESKEEAHEGEGAGERERVNGGREEGDDDNDDDDDEDMNTVDLHDQMMITANNDNNNNDNNNNDNNTDEDGDGDEEDDDEVDNNNGNDDNDVVNQKSRVMDDISPLSQQERFLQHDFKIGPEEGEVEGNSDVDMILQDGDECEANESDSMLNLSTDFIENSNDVFNDNISEISEDMFAPNRVADVSILQRFARLLNPRDGAGTSSLTKEVLSSLKSSGQLVNTSNNNGNNNNGNSSNSNTSEMNPEEIRAVGSEQTSGRYSGIETTVLEASDSDDGDHEHSLLAIHDQNDVVIMDDNIHDHDNDAKDNIDSSAYGEIGGEPIRRTSSHLLNRSGNNLNQSKMLNSLGISANNPNGSFWLARGDLLDSSKVDDSDPTSPHQSGMSADSSSDLQDRLLVNLHKGYYSTSFRSDMNREEEDGTFPLVVGGEDDPIHPINGNGLGEQENPNNRSVRMMDDLLRRSRSATSPDGRRKSREHHLLLHHHHQQQQEVISGSGAIEKQLSRSFRPISASHNDGHLWDESKLPDDPLREHFLDDEKVEFEPDQDCIVESPATPTPARRSMSPDELLGEIRGPRRQFGSISRKNSENGTLFNI